MSNVFVGQISMFGGNFAPRNYAFCNGQLMAIAQNQALFSLIGTNFGGNGVTTFALPNLQSSLPLHYGTGPGQPTYNIGQVAGNTTVTILPGTMPAHTPALIASTGNATTGNVAANVMPATSNGPTTPAAFYANPVQGGPALTIVPMGSVCGPIGGTQPHSNLMPSLCITFIVALFGIFPSRN
jgi:microcystin-dependent protein